MVACAILASYFYFFGHVRHWVADNWGQVSGNLRLASSHSGTLLNGTSSSMTATQGSLRRHHEEKAQPERDFDAPRWG